VNTSLLAGFSIVYVVISFAAQSTLGNLVSGISLMLYKPFRKGDRLSDSSQIFRIVEDRDRLSKMGDAYSDYASYNIDAQVINVTDFDYSPGTYWNRSDRKQEYKRIYEKYNTTDKAIVY